MKIISRLDAGKHGLTRYYTGRPCIRGHDCERLVTNGSCLQCQKLWNRAYVRKLVEFRNAAIATKN